MKKKGVFLRRISALALAFSIMLGMLAAPQEVCAANLVEEYRDMIGQGGYIYYIKSRTTAEGDGAVIYRMKVSTAEKSKVLEAKKGVLSMCISGGSLFYTTYSEDGKDWEIWRCNLDGSGAEKVCDGYVCHANGDTVYGIKYVSDKTRLFCRDLASKKSTSIRTVKERVVLDYVCNLGTTGYYYTYNWETDKVTLYSLPAKSTKLIKVATEKRNDNDSTTALLVSDVKQVDGELYYDYGSYVGTANYWYGTIKKLTVDGKKKTVGKDVGNDEIIVGSRELYYNDALVDTYYKYSFSTGKSAKYSLAYKKDVSYIILGDKTYMADTSNKKKITISRFNSGTAQETLTKNFITIPFKQKTNVSYTVSMKQVGIYNMVCVKGIDYTDASYGWRGNLVSINWYITDGAGTVLGSFS